MLLLAVFRSQDFNLDITHKTCFDYSKTHKTGFSILKFRHIDVLHLMQTHQSSSKSYLSKMFVSFGSWVVSFKFSLHLFYLKIIIILYLPNIRDLHKAKGRRRGAHVNYFNTIALWVYHFRLTGPTCWPQYFCSSN